MDKYFINAFVQMRVGSTRLPEKSLKKFETNQTLFDLVYHALSQSKYLDKNNIILVTTTNPLDDRLINFALKYGLKYFRGDENNVLKRFYDASKQYNSKYVIRVCGDNPFLQPEFIDDLIEVILKDQSIDYISYADEKGTPSILTHWGFFVEIIKKDALIKAYHLAKTEEEFEHVTKIFYSKPDYFKIKFLKIPGILNEKKFRFTIDTNEDFKNINKILMKAKGEFHYKQLLKIVEQDSQIQKSMGKLILDNSKN